MSDGANCCETATKTVVKAAKATAKGVKCGLGKAIAATAPTAASKGCPDTSASAALRAILPSGYGFVVLTAVGSVLLLTWKAMKVGMARDEFKVPYPLMYSPESTSFNCVQRAHQNTLENYPQFLLALLIGGLEMPYFCTFGGCIWIMGRICYARGYYTGDPHKRARGSFAMLGMVMCLAATTRFALRQIGWYWRQKESLLYESSE